MEKNVLASVTGNVPVIEEGEKGAKGATERPRSWDEMALQSNPEQATSNGLILFCMGMTGISASDHSRRAMVSYLRTRYTSSISRTTSGLQRGYFSQARHISIILVLTTFSLQTKAMCFLGLIKTESCVRVELSKT